MKKLAAACLALTACGATDWMGDPSGPGSRWTASFGWVVFAVCTAVSASFTSFSEFSTVAR